MLNRELNAQVRSLNEVVGRGVVLKADIRKAEDAVRPSLDAVNRKRNEIGLRPLDLFRERAFALNRDFDYFLDEAHPLHSEEKKGKPVKLRGEPVFLLKEMTNATR